MPDYYSRQTWANGAAGGTPLSASRLNHQEEGIDDLDAVVQDLVDRVDALEAGAGGVGGGLVGSTADRALVAPGAGVMFFDTTLGYPVWGTGSGWVEADGTAVAGAGSANAPTNFAAEVQPDNSVVFTWSAVTGATSYKLYASDATSGVTGQTSIVGTSTTYSPSPATGVRTFWLTATVSAVESAASNQVQVQLPYSGTGTGGGDTPAEILNLNGEGDASGGHWNLGIGFRPSDPEAGGTAKHIDITYSALKNGYVRDPYCVPNATNTGVKMRVYCDGGRTSTNTKYPRSEFRELQSNGTTKAAWSASSGTHTMEWKVKVLHQTAVKPEISLGQIHDGSDDRFQLRWEDGDISCNVNGGDSDGGVTHEVDTNLSIGDEIHAKIVVNSSQLRFYYGGVLQFTESFTGSGMYFKLGTYGQSNNRDQANSASDYHEAEFYDLTVTHA